jgi:tryptophan synthase beta subunit
LTISINFTFKILKFSISEEYQIIIINLSGRGDKDVAQVASKIGLQMPT